MPGSDCIMTHSGSRQQHAHGMQALTFFFFFLPEEEKVVGLVGGVMTLHFWRWKDNI